MKVKQLIQVYYSDNADVKERELKALLRAGKALHCNDLLAITENKSGEERIGGKKIIYIPLWSWLLRGYTEQGS